MGGLIKQRTIRLVADTEPPDQDWLVGILMKPDGMESVTIDRNTVTVRYDNLKTGFPDIVKQLHEAGCETNDDIYSRLKTVFYELQDRNERQHAAHPFGYAVAIQTVYMNCQEYTDRRRTT